MYVLLLSTRNSGCFALPTYAGSHTGPMTMIMIPNNLIVNSHSLSQIPSTKFLFLIYFSPYQTDLGPTSDWIELYRSKNAPKKKKSRARIQLHAWLHDASMCRDTGGRGKALTRQPWNDFGCGKQKFPARSKLLGGGHAKIYSQPKWICSIGKLLRTRPVTNVDWDPKLSYMCYVNAQKQRKCGNIVICTI